MSAVYRLISYCYYKFFSASFNAIIYDSYSIHVLAIIPIHACPIAILKHTMNSYNYPTIITYLRLASNGMTIYIKAAGGLGI